jgi:hypothetical protein
MNKTYEFNFGYVEITSTKNFDIHFNDKKVQNISLHSDILTFKKTRDGFKIYCANNDVYEYIKSINNRTYLKYYTVQKIYYINSTYIINIFNDGVDINDIDISQYKNNNFYFPENKQLILNLYIKNNSYYYKQYNNIFNFISVSTNKTYLIYKKDNIMISDEKHENILDSNKNDIINTFSAEYDILFINYTNDEEKKYLIS